MNIPGIGHIGYDDKVFVEYKFEGDIQSLSKNVEEEMK